MNTRYASGVECERAAVETLLFCLRGDVRILGHIIVVECGHCHIAGNLHRRLGFNSLAVGRLNFEHIRLRNLGIHRQSGLCPYPATHPVSP